VISTRIAFHDLDPAAWRNAQRLLLPPSRTGGHGPGGPRRPPLILFLEDGRCVKVLRPGAGAGPPPVAADYPWAGPWSLGRLRRAAGAPWAIAVDEGALERIFTDYEREATPDLDLVAQGLAFARALRAERGRGLHLDPDPFAVVPVPPFAALQRTFDALLPDGRGAALFVFDRSALWTSVIVEKQGGDVVRVTTHAALDPAAVAHGFRQGAHRDIVAAVERRVCRLHLGAFVSLDAWREIVGPSPGALARQVAAREAVLDPAPPWLLALAGIGAVAGVAQEATRLLGRFVPQAVKDTARALSPFSALGFDPIAAFVELRRMVDVR